MDVPEQLIIPMRGGAMSIRLEVWGDNALFTRGEFKTERVTYDVMTPSAARGILEAIFWHPGMCWRIDRIHVLNPIRFDSIRRNEVDSVIDKGKIRAMAEGRGDGVPSMLLSPSNNVHPLFCVMFDM